MSHNQISWEQAHRDAVERGDMAIERAAKAAMERDAQCRWTVEIAMLLGVSTEVTPGTTTSEQYGELRARITDALQRLHDLMVRHNALVERIEMLEKKPTEATRWIVELEPGTWTAPWSGDPGRTCSCKNANHHHSIEDAEDDLQRARRYRAFPDARILRSQEP